MEIVRLFGMLCLTYPSSSEGRLDLFGYVNFRTDTSYGQPIWVLKETDHDNTACRRSDVATLSCRAEWLLPCPRAHHRPYPVDVDEIIGEMVLLMRSEANDYAVSIRMDLAADLPKITADRVQLQQVLMNLMLNGIEAMKETGGVLTVKTERGEGGEVLFSVSDTGAGLPIGRADEIFNAFFTTKPQGSGMGLAISRSIVESHGGRLWATSNDGQGATFHFRLPVASYKRSEQNRIDDIFQ